MNEKKEKNMNIRKLTQQIEVVLKEESERVFKLVLDNSATIEDLYSKSGRNEILELISKQFIESDCTIGGEVISDIVLGEVRRKVTNLVMSTRIESENKNSTSGATEVEFNESRLDIFHLKEKLNTMTNDDINCWALNYIISIKRDEDYKNTLLKERVNKIIGNTEILSVEKPLEIAKIIVKTKKNFYSYKRF